MDSSSSPDYHPNVASCVNVPGEGGLHSASLAPLPHCLPISSEAPPVDGKDSPLSQRIVVAVHIRPLTTAERLQGCKDSITVVPGEPQVQLGSNFFTFDHVCGSSGSPSSAIFDECVAPLIDALFQGYNATVLAYGQTGSGKTYTMGTGFAVGGCTDGITPRVMEALFKRAESFTGDVDLQLRVSFIEVCSGDSFTCFILRRNRGRLHCFQEGGMSQNDDVAAQHTQTPLAVRTILKEEVHDLLDPNPSGMGRPEPPAGLGFFSGGCKGVLTIKPSIQIRETTNGEIVLAGVREIDVQNLQEMALCLEQGALCRATGSTNMNPCSSRSHAIFTVTLEQRRKLDLSVHDAQSTTDDLEDFLCAKLHLVDLAGSERAKRTGTDGLRFKEGFIRWKQQDSYDWGFLDFPTQTPACLRTKTWGLYGRAAGREEGIFLRVDDIFIARESLKKEGRRNEFEMKKLHTLNQRQKMVLQRKTEEAAAVTRRLKELLEVRKHVARESSCQGSAASDDKLQIRMNEKELQQWLNHELEVAVRINEVRTAYEKQTDARTSIAKELEELRKEEDSNQGDQSQEETSFANLSVKEYHTSSTSAMARKHRICFLDSLLTASSSALIEMAAELSDAEERERALTEHTRWSCFQSLGEVKCLLQLTFNAAAVARAAQKMTSAVLRNFLLS
ncbi:hypothetical protein L7F22_047791 [Adiantum nelumboides]|nr:hypothetical protein [Adiantum nelumboides]